MLAWFRDFSWGRMSHVCGLGRWVIVKASVREYWGWWVGEWYRSLCNHTFCTICTQCIISTFRCRFKIGLTYHIPKNDQMLPTGHRYAPPIGKIKSTFGLKISSKLFSHCAKVLSQLSQSCPKIVSMLPWSCLKFVRMLSKNCIKVVWNLTKNVSHLSSSLPKLVAKLT